MCFHTISICNKDILDVCFSYLNTSMSCWIMQLKAFVCFDQILNPKRQIATQSFKSCKTVSLCLKFNNKKKTSDPSAMHCNEEELKDILCELDRSCLKLHFERNKKCPRRELERFLSIIIISSFWRKQNYCFLM